MKKKNTPEQKLKRKLKRKIKKEDNNIELKKIKKKKTINFKKKNKIKINKTIGLLSKKKRMLWEMIIALSILSFLTLRILYIQFVMGEKLKDMAYMQQTLDRSINPKRGTIYDATRAKDISNKFNCRNSNYYTYKYIKRR